MTDDDRAAIKQRNEKWKDAKGVLEEIHSGRAEPNETGDALITWAANAEPEKDIDALLAEVERMDGERREAMLTLESMWDYYERWGNLFPAELHLADILRALEERLPPAMEGDG